ncbi:hypothetical protein MCQ_01153 [Candidatus Bartonella washoeensis Sb944nv]|uniref:Uncharacterized protein n=1 Tax=Candidatus Bartonella washoeensis Sb944nv TaxID=1094563 RepID=J0Q7Y8_9HYPH|nr:hypothetical protein MCQ_01153 [Bartonella washoeensis Sb944nv]
MTAIIKISSFKIPLSQYLKNFTNQINPPIKSIMDECIFTDRKPKKCKSNLYTDTFEKEFMTTANAKVETCSTYEPITVHNTYIKGEHMNFTQCSFLVQNGPLNQVYLLNQRALTSYKN